MTHAGWLTLYEVLDTTGLTWKQVTDLTKSGALLSDVVGTVVLYDPGSVAIAAGGRSSTAPPPSP